MASASAATSELLLVALILALIYPWILLIVLGNISTNLRKQADAQHGIALALHQQNQTAQDDGAMPTAGGLAWTDAESR